MTRTRQVVLFRQTGGPGAKSEPGMLGTRREMLRQLARFNTAPDGAPEDALQGGPVAYGPGIIVQFPYGDADDPVRQALVGISEEEIAWAVLQRICAATGWSMMDPDTGRVF